MSKASQIRQKAQELLSKGQIEKAIQEYRRLISVESKNPNLYNELGDIFLRTGDKEQAIQSFEKASTLYEKVALYNNAVAVCKKILRVDADRIDALVKLAELRVKQKLEGEAAAYFNQFADSVLTDHEKLQRSQAKVDRILELMPNNETVLERSAEIFLQLGMKLRAAEILSKLMSDASQRGDSKRQARYRIKVEQIRSELSPDESAKMKEFEELQQGSTVESPASSEDSRERIGEETPSTAKRGSTGAGEALDNNEIAIEETSPVSEREEETEPEVSQTIEEAEMVAAMSRGLADMPPVQEREGRGAKGKEAASEEEPVAPSRLSEERSLRSSDEERMQREKDSRGEDFEEEFKKGELVEEITSDVEKDDLRSHYDLGMAYLEMGLYNEAIRDFQIASRCPELQVSSMEMIGYCFLKSGQARLAVKQLQRALEIAKRTGAETLGIHYNLGLAFEMLGEWASAREHFEEVYIVDMSFRDVAEKIKKASTVS